MPSPSRAALLEEGAQALLALVARAPLGRAGEQVILVARLEDEPLRLARRRSGPPARMSATTRSTAASRSAATSSTRPIRSAVAASIRSPVRKYRRAAAGPIRASTIGEITAGMIPSRTSENPKTASSPAIAMSAQAVRPEPPPSA